MERDPDRHVIQQRIGPGHGTRIVGQAEIRARHGYQIVLVGIPCTLKETADHRVAPEIETGDGEDALGGGGVGSGGSGGNNQCDNGKNNEVFHISNNKHTYEEARKICSKYKSRLATYNEIENAYNNGANWCSYGWSEDQLALFPTQKEVYDNLKTITGHENDCGRQGVNGGFIDNPYVKFGVNCYGEKPEETQQDKEYMERLKLSYSPAVDDSTINEDAKNYIISPFNREKWKEK